MAIDHTASISKRVYYFDFLNVLSCFAVVILHTNAYFSTFGLEHGNALRAFYETFFYFAVPIFFMLSGVNLLNYRRKYSTKVFFQRRIKKTFIPFAVFSLFFLFYTILQDSRSQTITDFSPYFRMFLTGSIPKTHFWFFPDLFLVYLFIPFFSLLSETISRKHLLLLLILLIAAQSFVFPFLNRHYNISLILPIGGYVTYFLLGHYIHKYRGNSTIFFVCLFISIISLSIRYRVLLRAEDISDTLSVNSYFGPWAFFPSIILFRATKHVSHKSPCGQNSVFHLILAQMAKRSLGIYLIHGGIIHLIKQLSPLNNPYYTLITAISVYLISFLITSALQQFKLTRWLAP